jgi:hypothetical protein
MTNYNPKYEPTAINELILEHIDFVMHEECETKQDVWTLEKILSWERFGSTICERCHENREKLLYRLIRKWQDEYDYKGVIRRGVTEYRELPYNIKSLCQRIAMDTVKLREWDLNDLYEYGRQIYMREIKQSEVIDLTISNTINERNIEYLIDRFDKFEQQCITKKMITDKKQFPHLSYDY